jgi:hypothetical protein
MTVTRRWILTSAALTFLGTPARAAGAVTISVDGSRTLGAIPPDYIGLGYEISSVAIPGLLSAKNAPYVGLVKALGPQGVIRIGGNTSDFSTYAANGSPVSSPKGSVVTDANLTELRGFLDALNWQLIWGLNLGADQLENAVAEAGAVARIFSDRLIALEVGNEPDLFGRAGHRPAGYNYDAWLKDYRRYKAAVRAVLPGARFAGPDLAASADWMTRFARDEGGDIALLTAHHYVTGKDKPDATVATLLAQEKKFIGSLATFREAAKAAGKPWRMVETNSFYGGGKDGVSNSFASALWVLDYLLVLARYGCAGVNMETGVNHLGKISYYTPIGDDLTGNYTPAPEYYGLKAFAQMPKGELLGVDIQAGGINLAAHAVRKGRELCVAVINKDAQETEAAIRVSGYRSGRVLRLTGPEPQARDGVLLGGVPVAANGAWSGAKYEPGRVAHDRIALHVPAASAALVWLS